MVEGVLNPYNQKGDSGLVRLDLFLGWRLVTCPAGVCLGTTHNRRSGQMANQRCLAGVCLGSRAEGLWNSNAMPLRGVCVRG